MHDSKNENSCGLSDRSRNVLGVILGVSLVIGIGMCSAACFLNADLAVPEQALMAKVSGISVICIGIAVGVMFALLYTGVQSSKHVLQRSDSYSSRIGAQQRDIAPAQKGEVRTGIDATRREAAALIQALIDKDRSKTIVMVGVAIMAGGICCVLASTAVDHVSQVLIYMLGGVAFIAAAAMVIMQYCHSSYKDLYRLENSHLEEYQDLTLTSSPCCF